MSGSKDKQTLTVAETVERAMNTLSTLFKDHCKLTFIMRNPLVPQDGHMIITDDNVEELIEVLGLALEQNRVASN